MGDLPRILWLCLNLELNLRMLCTGTICELTCTSHQTFHLTLHAETYCQCGAGKDTVGRRMHGVYDQAKVWVPTAATGKSRTSLPHRV
jgi:hypothetical protein